MEGILEDSFILIREVEMKIIEQVGIVDISGMFDDTALGRLKEILFLQENRIKLIYMILDACLTVNSHANGRHIVRTSIVVLHEDFFPMTGIDNHIDFVVSCIGILINAGLFDRKGKERETLSFRFENQADDLRQQIKKELCQNMELDELNKWLEDVAMIYSQVDRLHAIDESKERTLN